MSDGEGVLKMCQYMCLNLRNGYILHVYVLVSLEMCMCVCVCIYLHVFVRYVCVYIHLHVIRMCQHTHTYYLSVCLFVHVHTWFGLFRSIDMYLCVCEMCMCVHLCGCV